MTVLILPRGLFCKNLFFPSVPRERKSLGTSFFCTSFLLNVVTNFWPFVLLSSFSSTTLSLANLSLSYLAAISVASSPSLGVSVLGGSYSKIYFGSSSIIFGLTFSLTVTEIALTKF